MNKTKPDIRELVEGIRAFGEDCDSDACRECQVSYLCDSGWGPEEIADVIQELFDYHKKTFCEGCAVCPTGKEDPERCEDIYWACSGIPLGDETTPT